MRIAVGADHAGYELKAEILSLLEELGHSYRDFGPHKKDPEDDYPDFGVPVARAVAKGEFDLGILICGSGVGMCILANKVGGIRAALCHDTFCARSSREHDDANILCLGARVIGVELAKEIVKTWLSGAFSGADRHQRRLKKVTGLEEGPA
jgi:ribose 5-phosphate isomerase B